MIRRGKIKTTWLNPAVGTQCQNGFGAQAYVSTLQSRDANFLTDYPSGGLGRTGWTAEPTVNVGDGFYFRNTPDRRINGGQRFSKSAATCRVDSQPITSGNFTLIRHKVCGQYPWTVSASTALLADGVSGP